MNSLNKSFQHYNLNVAFQDAFLVPAENEGAHQWILDAPPKTVINGYVGGGGGLD